MLKTNKQIKSKLEHFLNIIVLILIILFNRTNIAYGANINWIEVEKTPTESQHLDRNSLDRKGKK